MATCIAATLIGAGLTELTRRFAVRHGVLDRPSPRGLHRDATPRGGGIAIVLIVLAATATAGLFDALPSGAAPGLLIGGALVAGIGALDDLRGVRVGYRAIVHFLAAAWLVAAVGGLPDLRMGTQVVRLGVAGSLLAVAGVVWSINLYNFMDGIDGLAGGQAALGGVIGALLFLPVEPGLAFVAAALSGGALGFLWWNWAPSKVFMGDAGSGLLGFLFAALGLLSERSGAAPLLSWVLLGWVFLFDSTVTLLRRAVQRQRLWMPHRSHAYQRIVQSGWSHARASAMALLLTLGFGFLALKVERDPQSWMTAAGLAAVASAGAYGYVERRMPMRAGAAGAAPGGTTH